MILLLCIGLFLFRIVIREHISDASAQFVPVEQDILPSLDRIEKPVCVIIFSEENYTGTVRYLKAGQYLDPEQIAEIMQFASLKIPPGVLLQFSGDNALNKSFAGATSISKWEPLSWRVMEILILKSDLVGEKNYGVISGMSEKATFAESPAPDSVLSRISEPTSNHNFSF